MHKGMFLSFHTIRNMELSWEGERKENELDRDKTRGRSSWEEQKKINLNKHKQRAKFARKLLLHPIVVLAFSFLFNKFFFYHP